MQIFRFKNSKNGLVLEITTGKEKEVIVYQESEDMDEDMHRFKEFLYTIIDSYAPDKMRDPFDKYYLYLIQGPGDEYEGGENE